MRKMLKLRPSWCSHLPVLNRVLPLTKGPVLELGAGLFSTPFLHWICQDKGLKLESFEKEAFFKEILNFSNDNHKVTLIDDWDKIDIDNTHWGVVFIDHNEERRSVDAIRLANNADYIVLHDTQYDRHNPYNYNLLWKHFKYVKHFDQFSPRTSVVSNFYEVKDL